MNLITELVQRFMELGWWGFVGAALIFIASAASTLFLERKIVGNHTRPRDIQWTQVALVMLSTLLLLISAVWSGWQKFNDLFEANPAQAWIVAGGFVVCGLVVSTVLHYVSAIAIRENNGARWIAVAWMFFVSIFWLCISPFQNARFLCAPETVRSEIELRFTQLDRYSKGLIGQYSLYRNRIIPRLVEIQEALDSMVQEQSKPELGGCGPICEQYQYYHDLLEPSVIRLANEYGYNDPDLDYQHRINEMRTLIMKLLNSNYHPADELGTIFFQYASEWVEMVTRIKTMDSPELTLEQSMASLRQLLDFLNNFKENNSDSPIRAKAVQRALSTLAPLVNDLELANGQNKDRPRIQPVSFAVSSFGQPDFNLAAIAGIRMNTVLMRKHLKRIWPEALLAIFIDIAGMGFIYIPMFIAFFRGRPGQKALAAVRRRKIALRRLQSGIEEVDHAIDIHIGKRDKYRQTLAEQLARLSREEKDQQNRWQKNITRKKQPLLSRRQRLTDRREEALAQVDRDEQKALNKAVSSSDELLILGRHEVYRENIRKDFQRRLDILAGRLKSLEEQSASELADIRANFSRRKQIIRDEYARKEKQIAKKIQRLKEKRQKLKKALAAVQLKLEEAEEWSTCPEACPDPV